MTISIIIPCHNEEKNIGSLLDSLLSLNKKQNFNAEIIVVNDNSKDKTAKVTEEFQKKNSKVKVLHRNKGNNGMGFALREGTRASTGKYVIWIMGDKSDDLNTIPLMINKLENGYDMVFGSRYMQGASRGDLSLFKAILSHGFTFISRLVFGIKVHDITNAFRGFKREVFDSIDIKAGDFAISPELAIKAHNKGYILGEVPTIYTDRTKGKSKFALMKMGVRYSKLLLLKFEK